MIYRRSIRCVIKACTSESVQYLNSHFAVNYLLMMTVDYNDTSKEF